MPQGGEHDLAVFTALLAPAGQAALAEAMALRPRIETFLACVGRLEKHFPTPLARAALEMALLRHKARPKFERADAMYFTREALEQASGEIVSRYRAGRFAGRGPVGDFCCGLGGDALGLASMADVLAVDADPLRLALAEQNLAVHGLRDRATFLQGDLERMPLPEVAAVFLDPDRRSHGRRLLSLHDYSPPPEHLRARLPADVALGVKAAPGVAWEEVQATGAEAEFVSVRGELKECTLWFGPLRGTARRATLLPGPHTLAAETPAAPRPVGPPRAYLYDPDAAVVRAGLVADLAERLDAHPLDPTIAYLTADTLHATPFAHVYVVEEALPFQLKRLRERLRARQVGRITVLKRGSPLTPEELCRRLRLAGPESRVVVLTRVAGKPWALIAAPVV